MKKLTSIIVIAYISLTLISCTSKNYNTQSAQVTIKTHEIKINDTGFLYNNKFYKVVEVFKLTKKILTIKTSNNQICVNGSCYLKKDFNKNFFGTYYYDELLDDILTFQPIFNKSNYEKEENGCFTQNLKDNIKEISYKVCNDSLYFKDTKHNTTIKIKIFTN